MIKTMEEKEKETETMNITFGFSPEVYLCRKHRIAGGKVNFACFTYQKTCFTHKYITYFQQGKCCLFYIPTTCFTHDYITQFNITCLN